MGAVAQQQIFADLDPLRADPVHFIQHRPRIDDHARRDHADFARAQDACRQQREFVFHAVEDHRMAGVVASLIAHDNIMVISENIDNLALGLVAPLQTDNRSNRHVEFPVTDDSKQTKAIQCSGP